MCVRRITPYKNFYGFYFKGICYVTLLTKLYNNFYEGFLICIFLSFKQYSTWIFFRNNFFLTLWYKSVIQRNALRSWQRIGSSVIYIAVFTGMSHLDDVSDPVWRRTKTLYIVASDVTPLHTRRKIGIRFDICIVSWTKVFFIIIFFSFCYLSVSIVFRHQKLSQFPITKNI